MVGHELEGEVGLGFALPHGRPDADQPGPALQMEEFALAHDAGTMTGAGAEVNSQERDAVKKPDDRIALAAARRTA
jgi:hypothetical protein